MVNHWFDDNTDQTLCGDYKGRLAWSVSANYAVSCPECRDLLPEPERADQKYPLDQGDRP